MMDVPLTCLNPATIPFPTIEVQKLFKSCPGHARSHQNFVVSLPIPFENLPWFIVPRGIFLMCLIHSRSHKILLARPFVPMNQFCPVRSRLLCPEQSRYYLGTGQCNFGQCVGGGGYTTASYIPGIILLYFFQFSQEIHKTTRVQWWDMIYHKISYSHN